MSGILRLLKNKVIAVTFILAIFFVLLAFLKMYVACSIFFLLLILHCLLYFLSKTVRRKLIESADVFTAFGNKRNVDYLIIGDMYEAQEKGIIVQLSAPGRGIDSCYEILRHTHSILKPGGEVIIAVKKSSMNNLITAFDTPFFHSITIKKLHLEKIKGKEHRIAYFYPLKSLMYLLNVRCKTFNESKEIDSKIFDFCRERGYKLRYKLK